jgi:hypothetical protein
MVANSTRLTERGHGLRCVLEKRVLER